MVLSLWDMSIESIDGVGHFRTAHKDLFPEILSGRKVGTPPPGARASWNMEKGYVCSHYGSACAPVMVPWLWELYYTSVLTIMATVSPVPTLQSTFRVSPVL